VRAAFISEGEDQRTTTKTNFIKKEKSIQGEGKFNNAYDETG